MALRAVSFTWPRAAEPVLSEVELELDRGWYGLVGENGAGKSTLLSIVCGERAPTAGRVLASGPVVRVPQESTSPTAEVFHFAEDEGGEARALRRDARLEPAMLSRWASLSSGERKRWLIAAAVWTRPEILLLDEPESHLDATGRELLVSALRQHRGLGIIVAHDRDLLDALTTRTIHVDRGRVRTFEGGISAALRLIDEEKRALVRRRDELEELVETRSTQRDRARQVAKSASAKTSDRMKGIRDHDARSMAATNLANWAAAGHAKRARKAEDAFVKAKEELDSVRIERELGGDIAFGFERSGRAIVASVEAEVVMAGDRVLLRDVGLFVGREDRIHVAGDNGVGKSTLLGRLLATAEAGRSLFLPQELDAARVAGLRAEVDALTSKERGRCYQVVAALGAPPERLMKSERLSPGEAKKLALALGVARGAWLLVLDEPENHLDLPSVERLAHALESWPGALVMVTHDLALARRVTTTTWRLEGGRVITSAA